MDNLVLILITFVTAMCVIVDCGCVFQNGTYTVGDSWNLSDFGTCVNCTCQLNERGEPEVRCKSIADKCPKLTCNNPRKNPHSCCPYCEVREMGDTSTSSKLASCKTVDGRTYNDGDRYSSNSTGLRPTSDNQCVMCTCKDGQSLCHLKTCMVLTTCMSVFYTSEDCCPVCADCVDADGVKTNGSQWHPTIAAIGKIDCITCSCLNGEIRCKKECIPDHDLPCQNPKKPNGECCRSCPKETSNPGNGGKNKRKSDKNKNKKDRHEQKGKGTKRRKKCKGQDKDSKLCKTRRRRRKDGTTTAAIVKPTVSVGVDLENLCIKKKSTYLVYKSISDTEMLIAFDDIETNLVDVHRWTVNKENQRGVVTYTEPETIPSQEFRRKINNTNVVGTTGKSQYKKFKKRLTEKLDKCKADCEPEMFIKVLQRVNVHLLKFGEQC